MPALLTRMSIEPQAAVTSAASRVTSAATVTSAWKPPDLPAGRAEISAAAASHALARSPGDRDVGAGLGQRVAIVRPSPRAPPVTSATLPSSRNESRTDLCAM